MAASADGCNEISLIFTALILLACPLRTGLPLAGGHGGEQWSPVSGEVIIQSVIHAIRVTLILYGSQCETQVTQR